MKSPEQHKTRQQEIIGKLPDKPGVYFFRDKDGKILYIGKATSLKDRVRSYFSADIIHTRGPLIQKMLEEFHIVDHHVTDSVLEALILEAHLIKKHHPPANVLLKDDRSFNFVVITDEAFPRVLVLRGRELFISSLSKKEERQLPYKVAHSFGPFTNGAQLREAMKLVRKLFPYRDKCIPVSEVPPSQRIKPCFNAQIGLCPGVCAGTITEAEYAENIKNIILLFEGNKKGLVKNMEKQMKLYAEAREFEKAEKVKRVMFGLNHINDISLIKEDVRRGVDPTELFRVESYDIAHMSGQHVVGVMTVVEDGEAKKSDYRKFKIKDDPGVNDTKALSEVLTRRLGHIEWHFPNLIVVDGGLAQKRVMERILKQNNVLIPVVSVVKDEHHKPKQILGDKKWLRYEKEIILSNAEAHRYGISYHRQLRSRI